jgi:predicted nuclease of predicted toxin-antitoxin system
MKILFDQGVPVPLMMALEEHEVTTAHKLGWGELSNSDLIAQADQRFDVLITTDKNLAYQQNISKRKIAIFILPTTRWPALKPHGALIVQAITAANTGGYHAWALP